MTNAIEAEGLRRGYSGGFEAVRGISFTVPRGEIFALLGTNGAGKTSTVELLEGLAARPQCRNHPRPRPRPGPRPGDGSGAGVGRGPGGGIGGWAGAGVGRGPGGGIGGGAGAGIGRGPGSGLAGLRERLAAVGGSLEAGPGDGGTFLVTTRVSVPRTSRMSRTEVAG
ncbi:ATP-binding cassette domain-containing protein [Streptomyces stackebrandtii]|uniref:ATP-binding cassette domain-containing protein n=1 Tax=Streptomyces stackebrandtii TaxID=3051177 RepID=UPI0028DC8F30|nr:ATP-binding cassette domain-containing protein [Streptomyces sp. DSM 40976]